MLPAFLSAASSGWPAAVAPGLHVGARQHSPCDRARVPRRGKDDPAEPDPEAGERYQAQAVLVNDMADINIDADSSGMRQAVTPCQTAWCSSRTAASAAHSVTTS